MRVRVSGIVALCVGGIVLGAAGSAEADRQVYRPAQVQAGQKRDSGYWQNGYPVGRLRVDYLKAVGQGQTSRTFEEYCNAPAGSHPNAMPIRSVVIGRSVSRPPAAQVGQKKVSMGSGMSAFLGGPRRTGVTHYGGGNYAVNYSNGAVGSMQGTSPSSPAPAGPVQTDTNNAGSSGSGGFDTPGHVVATGN